MPCERIRAEESSILESDYLGLAIELDLPLRNLADVRLAPHAVKRVLEARTKWLLVFDYAQKPEGIRSLIPQLGGHTIITSRNPYWSGLSEDIRVGNLSREESITFLISRTKQDDARTKGGPANQHNEAAKLAEKLGDLPLALEQATAYITETSSSIAEYVEIRAVMGHKSTAMTERYAHATDEGKRKAVEALQGSSRLGQVENNCHKFATNAHEQEESAVGKAS